MFVAHFVESSILSYHPKLGYKYGRPLNPYGVPRWPTAEARACGSQTPFPFPSHFLNLMPSGHSPSGGKGSSLKRAGGRSLFPFGESPQGARGQQGGSQRDKGRSPTGSKRSSFGQACGHLKEISQQEKVKMGTINQKLK